jgi:hypothetical protein
MNSNKYFILLAIFLISIKSFTNGSSFAEKNWESICSIFSCQPALNTCILNQCWGKDACRNCVRTQNQNCLRCVDDILNEEYFSINGTQTIICDSINSLHETTCNFYCRIKEKETWKCEKIGGYPLCNCNEPNFSSPTTVKSTTAPTTTENSNKPELLSKKLLLHALMIITIIEYDLNLK